MNGKKYYSDYSDNQSIRLSTKALPYKMTITKKNKTTYEFTISGINVSDTYSFGENENSPCISAWLYYTEDGYNKAKKNGAMFSGSYTESYQEYLDSQEGTDYSIFGFDYYNKDGAVTAKTSDFISYFSYDTGYIGTVKSYTSNSITMTIKFSDNYEYNQMYVMINNGDMYANLEIDNHFAYKGNTTTTIAVTSKGF